MHKPAFVECRNGKFVTVSTMTVKYLNKSGSLTKGRVTADYTGDNNFVFLAFIVLIITK